MKVIKIDKAEWTKGLDALRGDYRLFGPVKEKDYYNFKELAGDETPHMEMQNTRLSPKSLVFPQSETMLDYSLDPAMRIRASARRFPKIIHRGLFWECAPVMPRPWAWSI
jgi:hypothetical protein